MRLKGFPLKEAQEHLREIQKIDATEFTAYVERSRTKILTYHYEHNLFYKAFVGDTMPKRWEDVPILQKKDLQIPLQNRLSEGYNTKNVHQGKTSGSSGTPLHYAKDKYCHALTWAGIIDRFSWYDIDFHTSYQARFYGIPLEPINYQKERLKDRLSGRYRFPIFDLSDEKLQQFLDVFRKKSFDHINGHTSSIVLFAKFLKRKGIKLLDVCPSLRYCIVTSEMLFRDDKELLESQLGIPVINEYGASELDLLAFTNPEGDFQINSENLYLEIVDDRGKLVPHGSPGRILVTQLYNKAHPFIRYEVGDIGVLDRASTSKKPILKELLGRSNDTAVLANGTTVPGHTFYYVAKSAMGNQSVVQEFSMTQHSLSDFSMTYVAERELNEEEINALKKALRQYLKADVQLKTRRVATLDRSHRGKLKQFISEL
ncbi:MAG: phenylacetate--CoA ligase family protein [Marinirhabdus sp.]|nr:phenylacetate--CoA ligase family protein [Marinirhabdus sp.]